MTATEKILEKLKTAPPGVAEEVLDFLEFLEARRKVPDIQRPATFEDFHGVLKNSPLCGDDPVSLQRKWRDEWR